MSQARAAEPMNRFGLLLLSAGHLAVDINPGALPALLPLLFLDGGNVGFALGPLMMGALLAAYGRPGALGMLLLGAGAAPSLWLAMRRVAGSAARARAVARGAAPTRRGALVLLVAVIFFRQW